MSTTRIASIYRYPIKGFNPESLKVAQLSVGQGIAYDRTLAIANGERDVAPSDVWTPCQAFMRLTKNIDLPRYNVIVDEQARTVQLTSPTGISAKLPLDGQTINPTTNDQLIAWFGETVKRIPANPVRARSNEGGSGYWDHEDATLSLINLETLKLLERFSGKPIDPLRFRANLYVSGLPPLAEFQSVGRQLRIGDAVVEIIRPIDRCSATSVDPQSIDTSLNMPALLSRAFGHVFCGVYARVIKAGTITPKASIVDMGVAENAVRDGSYAATAPGTADWPRPARVIERVAESNEVISFWLDDPLANLHPSPLAGQHLRVHLLDKEGAPKWRAYTISGVDGSRLRISVKRDGIVSNHLHSYLNTDDCVLISGPFGNTHLQGREQVNRPLICLSAGIGITPSVAMLRELHASQSSLPIFVGYVARTGGDLALRTEVQALADGLQNTRTRLHLTAGTLEECAAHQAFAGRPDFVSWLGADIIETANIYLCGPRAFLSETTAALIKAGADPECCHVEVFASPQTTTAPVAPKCEEIKTGPFRVSFAASEKEAVWNMERGTLLDLAEQIGLAPPANCRSGACGTCRVKLLKGRAIHDPEPVMPVPADCVLLCCATPASDIELA